MEFWTTPAKKAGVRLTRGDDCKVSYFVVDENEKISIEIVAKSELHLLVIDCQRLPQ